MNLSGGSDARRMWSPLGRGSRKTNRMKRSWLPPPAEKGSPVCAHGGTGVPALGGAGGLRSPLLFSFPLALPHLLGGPVSAPLPFPRSHQQEQDRWGHVPFRDVGRADPQGHPWERFQLPGIEHPVPDTVHRRKSWPPCPQQALSTCYRLNLTPGWADSSGSNRGRRLPSVPARPQGGNV